MKKTAREKIAFLKALKEFFVDKKNDVSRVLKKEKFNQQYDKVMSAIHKEYDSDPELKKVVTSLKKTVHSIQDKEAERLGGDAPQSLELLHDAFDYFEDNIDRFFDKVKKNPTYQKNYGKELAEIEKNLKPFKQHRENYKAKREKVKSKLNTLEVHLRQNNWEVKKSTGGILKNLFGLRDIGNLVEDVANSSEETFEDFLHKNKDKYFPNPNYNPSNTRMKKEVKLTSLEKEDQQELYKKMVKKAYFKKLKNFVERKIKEVLLQSF